MIIETKSGSVNVATVVSAQMTRDGKNYPALRFVFPGKVTAADIAALTSGELVIDGYPHNGYNTLGEISVIVGRITTAEQERDQALGVLSLLAGRDDITVEEAAAQRAAIEQAVQSLGDAESLGAVSLFPAWTPGQDYTADHKVRYAGQLYKVLQPHTSQVDWAPDVAVSLFAVIN